MKASEIVQYLLGKKDTPENRVYFTYNEGYDRDRNRFTMTIELGTNIFNAIIFKQYESYKEDLDQSREILYEKVLEYLVESMFSTPKESLSSTAYLGFAPSYPIKDEAPEVSPEILKQLWDFAFPIKNWDFVSTNKKKEDESNNSR